MSEQPSPQEAGKGQGPAWVELLPKTVRKRGALTGQAGVRLERRQKCRAAGGQRAPGGEPGARVTFIYGHGRGRHDLQFEEEASLGL